MMLTQAQIVRAFGNPFPLVRRDGTISPRWEEKIIGYVKLPAPLSLSWAPSQRATRLKCHHLLVPHFARALKMAFDDPTVWASIGDTGGIYAWRSMRAGKALSTHAWGIAIDLDVADNEQGAVGEMHPRLIEMFESCGFLWGGTFGGRARDPMHFQFNDLSKL